MDAKIQSHQNSTRNKGHHVLRIVAFLACGFSDKEAGDKSPEEAEDNHKDEDNSQTDG